MEHMKVRDELTQCAESKRLLLQPSCMVLALCSKRPASCHNLRRWSLVQFVIFLHSCRWQPAKGPTTPELKFGGMQGADPPPRQVAESMSMPMHWSNPGLGM